MAINLLKRLESSVNSFRLTLTRIHDFIKDSITAIDKFQESGAGTIDVTDFRMILMLKITRMIHLWAANRKSTFAIWIM